MTGKTSSTLQPPRNPLWKPCPTCEGKGKVKARPPGTIVIRTECRQRAGAPLWSDSPKEIARALGILEVFIRIGIQEKEIRPVTICGRQCFLLDEVKEWYECILDGPPIHFEILLVKAFPNVSFVFDAKLGGYTLDRDMYRRLRSQKGR